MKKIRFYTEIAYILGLVLLAIGTAMMEKADFGVSMVVAPAYLVYLKLNPVFPFFSFGMAEYMLQLVLLIALALFQRKLRLSYLFSFITAFIYGLLLDGAMAIAGMIACNAMALRLFFYLCGMVVCAAGVSMLFNTYIAPEAYELVVKEASAALNRPVHRVKTVYDLCSCALAVVLSFIFFGFGVFEGVKLGTIFCALVNGTLIGLCSRLWRRRMDFCDGLKLRFLFERDQQGVK